MSDASSCPTCHQPMPVSATRVSFHYMFDSHVFASLTGTPKQMIDQAVMVIRHGGTTHNGYDLSGAYGMLCPAIVMAHDRELRRVGPPVHARTASRKDIAKFRKDAQVWAEAIMADRFIAERAKGA